MAGNFDYLKDIDSDLFGIINDAEKLYRDEYFEQCMTQTRRFGEHVCRRVLGSNRTTEITFDEMLATLNDKGNGSEQEKEFIEDLYFLKKQGNRSTHSFEVKQDGTVALECLQRAFEVGLNYAVFNQKSDSKILKLNYDIDLLVTGKKSKKSLSEKYTEEKEKITKSQGKTKNKSLKKSNKNDKQLKKQVYSMNSVPKPSNISIFWVLVGISFFVACLVMLFMVI